LPLPVIEPLLNQYVARHFTERRVGLNLELTFADLLENVSGPTFLRATQFNFLKVFPHHITSHHITCFHRYGHHQAFKIVI
jgi:hypothetical protein